MPKNKGAGGKNRRKGKGTVGQSRELVYKNIDDGQEYGQITKSVGNGFMEVLCFSSTGNVTRRAHIRGRMRKRVWMGAGDIVLVSTRGFQDSTCDILLKYTCDEARLLRARRQLPENVEVNKTDMIADDIVIFADEKDGDDDDDIVPKQNRNYDLPSIDPDEEIDIDEL